MVVGQGVHRASVAPNDVSAGALIVWVYEGGASERRIRSGRGRRLEPNSDVLRPDVRYCRLVDGSSGSVWLTVEPERPPN